jgi:perosamine synthetase
MFVNMNLLGRERFIAPEIKEQYAPGLCPVAEAIQPRLLQFKTNYWDEAEAQQQADILERTIASFR